MKIINQKSDNIYNNRGYNISCYKGSKPLYLCANYVSYNTKICFRTIYYDEQLREYYTDNMFMGYVTLKYKLNISYSI